MNALYSIEEQFFNDELQTVVKLNERHEVFQGHFPGRPVMPGVCMLQMLSQSLSVHLSLELELKHIAYIKFVHMWLPEDHQKAQIRTSYTRMENEVKIKSCSIYMDDMIFLKFKGQFYVKD